MNTYTNKLGVWVSAREGSEPVMVRLSVGDTIELAAHCDLWMRGAKFAEVRRIYNEGTVTIRVRPIVAGVLQNKLHTILSHHVMQPRAPKGATK